MPDRPVFAAGVFAAEAEAVTGRLLAEGIGDGLPVVPPTADRLAAMLAGVAEPGAVLGLVPPLFGELTAAEVAYFAVLAGAVAAELPVVLAAVRACLEPEFNLLGVQTTTGTAAVAVIVHGPVVDHLRLNHGANALGPGNRANACIGRAVALALAGIGGARPGETDMATLGQPARFTCCLPERPGGPFPLAADRGSAVTVFAAGGTAEVLPSGGGASPAELLDPVAEQLAGAALAAGDPGRMASCEQAVVLPPEIAGRLVAHGLTGADVRDYLFERGNAALAARAGLPGARVAVDQRAVRLVVSGGAGVKMLHLPGWIGGSRSVSAAVATPGGSPG